jgi:hypothetical protein
MISNTIRYGSGHIRSDMVKISNHREKNKKEEIGPSQRAKAKIIDQIEGNK